MYANLQIIQSAADQHQAEARRRAAVIRSVRAARVRASRPDRPPPVARRRRRINWA